jgi:hypothetical protein
MFSGILSLMKKFEGIVATGLATAFLAVSGTGCGETKQQSPEVVRGLTETIKPVAIKMAKRAIFLSKGNDAKLHPYYDDGKTTLSRYVDGPGDGFRDITLTFTGDESQVSLGTLVSIEIEEAVCEEDKEKKGEFNCTSGTTYTLYTPEATYEGQHSWETRRSSYIQLEGDDFPSGGTIDSVDDFEWGESAVPTARGIVNDASTSFKEIVAAPEF